GLIHSIGRWVFEESCQHLRQWLEKGYPFRGHLSINVCPWQFARPDFVNQLQEIIQYHRIDPHYLIIELTETALLHDLQDAVKKLNILRSLGMKIALDDFGTGYSSLAHLRDLPLDIIKIDKAFVNELDENKDHGLVESIISIGQLMKLDVVAEGVERQPR
ncbi:MAG: EAL domain-containing protein, partial [Synechococcaceae cyanobacterium RL_1_2]|nr:EAL domain-containing protein [Synechococcaceae cyanobacterium RL_1_2]